MDIHGKKFRPLHWKRRNWWLLPMVLAYQIMFMVAGMLENGAERLNDWVLDRIKG